MFSRAELYELSFLCGVSPQEQIAESQRVGRAVESQFDEEQAVLRRHLTSNAAQVRTRCAARLHARVPTY